MAFKLGWHLKFGPHRRAEDSAQRPYPADAQACRRGLQRAARGTEPCKHGLQGWCMGVVHVCVVVSHGPWDRFARSRPFPMLFHVAHRGPRARTHAGECRCTCGVATGMTYASVHAAQPAASYWVVHTVLDRFGFLNVSEYGFGILFCFQVLYTGKTWF